MTPERAAEILGVATDASAADVEHAFQRRARATHPDVSAANDPDVPSDAGTGFREAAEARRVLLAPRSHGGSNGRIVLRDGPRLQGPGLIAVWASLLVVAAFLAIFRAPYPFTIAEPLARWALLGASAIAFAVTGRRALLVIAIVAELATVAMSIAVTTFGGLVALLITLPALLGAFTAGIARQRWTARLRG